MIPAAAITLDLELGPGLTDVFHFHKMALTLTIDDRSLYIGHGPVKYALVDFDRCFFLQSSLHIDIRLI